MIGLNLGCGPIMLKNVDGIDFINIDHDNMYLQYARKQNAVFYCHDLSDGLPVLDIDEFISFINMSQFLEHLNLPSAEILLGQCYNIMESGATIRISVPDLELLLYKLRTNQMQEFEDQQPKQWYNKYQSQTTKFALLLFGSLHGNGDSGHKMCYDYESLKELLEHVGFTNVVRAKHDGRYEAPVAESHELVVIGVKP